MDERLKILIVGYPYIGKSAVNNNLNKFAIQYLCNIWVERYDLIENDEFINKKIKVDDKNIIITLESGLSLDDEYFKSHMLRSFQVFILMYSITNKHSFNEINKYYEIIKKVIFKLIINNL
jgi:broad-specificity NMP kinase